MSTSRFIPPDFARHQMQNVHLEEAPRARTEIEYDGGDMILRGESVVIRRLRSQVQRIAPYFRTALIRGEPGSGKQLVARAIHAHGPCAGGPFVVSNATTLAEAIANDISSASASSAASLLESARGGTLYLDGVGELPYPLQTGFFRFIKGCEERRVSASTSRSDLPRSDFYRADSRLPEMRIVAASHRDLRTLSAIGQFRQDLYARLSVVEIFVPSLRQRVEDIPFLAAWLLRRVADRTGQNHKTLAEGSLAHLEARLWPNNLRGLERAVAHAAALAEGVVIEPRHLLALVEPPGNPVAVPAARLDRLQDVIQQHVLEVLTRCGGNKLRAAELLGISRSTLYRMLDANLASGNPLME
jgi:DNA-binding NtrC family response regulator